MKILSNNNINFGKLRIDTQAKEKLNTMPNDYLDEVKKIGNNLENIENVDLILDKDLKISVVKTNDYNKYDYFCRLKAEMNNAGQYYYVEYGEEGHGGFWPNIPDTFSHYCKGDISEEYKKFQALDSLHQAEELSKMMDKSIIEQREKEKIKLEEENRKKLECIKTENEHKQKVDDVLSNFGFEKFEHKDDKTKSNNKKQSFLSRIFRHK